MKYATFRYDTVEVENALKVVGSILTVFKDNFSLSRVNIESV